MTTDINARSSFDHSDALKRYLERRVAAALRPYATHVEDIALRLFDANGPRGGANDKVVRISVSVKPWGRLTASTASSDVYLSVDKTADRLSKVLRRHRSRLKSRQNPAAAEGFRRDAD
jgi:ribosomal subunit interface protein